MLQLFKFSLIIFCSIRMFAQIDPNTDPNWDWINGDYPNIPYPSSQYKMYIANSNGQIVEAPIAAPWGQGNAWIGLQDMKKEDGWVLISRDFGTPNRYVWAPYQEGAPYFILYNKFRGILRFFIMVKSNQDLTSGALEIKFHAANMFRTATLTHLKPRAYATDKLTMVQNNAGLALSQNMNDNWAWADYPMAYDPTFNATENGAWLDFQVVGTIESQIKIAGTGTGINGTQKDVRDFVTGSNNGAVTLTTNAPEVYIPKDFSQFTTSVFGTASNWDKWKQTVIDFNKKLPIMEDPNPISLANNHLKLFLYGIENHWFFKGLPFIGAAVGLVDFLVSGGKKNEQTVQPSFTGMNLTLNGAITTTLKLPNPRRIQVPSSKLNPNIAVFGSNTPLVYNSNVGVLNLISTPVVKYKTYFQSYGNNLSRSYMDCQMQDNLNIAINPASGLILDSIMAYIVMDPSKNVSLQNPTADPDLNLLATWTTGTNPKLALETSADGKFIFRSRVVPGDAFKNQRVQGPIGNYTPDITIKIKAVLHRTDDPAAQPVLMVVTYEPDLVSDGTGNYPEPFYVRVTRDFEFDGKQTLPAQFSTIGQQILLSPEENVTKNGRNYSFAGWSDGVMQRERYVTSNGNFEAIYKLKHHSSEANSFSNNSSRKFIRTDDGTLHLVYSSMQKIWYEISTNGGSTWLLMNNGFPLNDNEAKNPSIDYYSSNVAIVYQENNNGNYKIQLHLFGANGNTYIQTAAATVADEVTEEYATDANPVIAYGYNGKAIICWETKTILNEGLKFMGASIGYGAISFYNATGFGDGYSTTPTIVTDKTSQAINYFNLAWSQGNPNNDNSDIYYYDLYFDNNNNILKRTTSPEIPSANCGYEKNYKPSITYLVQGNGQNAKLEWIGERNSEGEEEFEKSAAMAVEKNAIFKSRDGLNWYYYTWAFGTEVQSVNINRSGNTGYVIAWSQKPGSNFENKFVKNTSFSSIKTFNTTGRDIQINEGTSYNDMYCNSFSSLGLPYSFNLSQSVGSIQKENSRLHVSSGREGVINRDSSAIYFTLGDIEVNDQKIEFTEIIDNAPITNFELLNQNLVSEEFTLADNAHFSYSVQYGVLQKGESPSLSGNEYVKFTVLLIDALTNEVIGLYDEIEYNTSNLGLYENILYEVDVTGIGNRQVKLKLVVTGNISAEFNVTTRIADESIIAKGNSRNINFQGSLAVTEYALEQNYPNPFNPVTTINYQIPKSGRVVVKVYDILGKEIATLVNEEKEIGRYSVNFDASKLSSGVYLYELVANDYRAVKKLMVIK